MAATRHNHYDVVIIGGGMVGMSLALALQQLITSNSLKNSPKILLLESSTMKRQEALQPGFDERSTVLSYGTVSYLKKLKLWKDLELRAESIKTIHVSDQNQFGTTQIEASECGVDSLGFVLENQDLGLSLNKAILGNKDTEIASPVEVKQINHNVQSATLSCQSNNESFDISAALIVLADGGRSGLSEQLGIHRKQTNYDQVAIIANVSFTEAHQNVAYERFTPNGPLAILPLSDFEEAHRAALVWTQKTEDYTEILALEDDAFLARLQQEFGQRLGSFIKVGERSAYPLSLWQAEEQIRHNLVLLGNVAHALHPVAGQGFNLAFRDAMRLAENIAESLRLNVNPGDYSRLQAYLKSVESDQASTISFSHYLTRFFSNKQQALVWFRKLGLLSIDLLPPLKESLSKQAMGVTGRAIKVS